MFYRARDFEAVNGATDPGLARPMTVNDRQTDTSSLAPAMTASAATAATVAVVAGTMRPDDVGAFVLAAYDAHHRELANYVRAIERDRDTAGRSATARRTE